MRMCTASQHFPRERQYTHVFLWSGDADGIGNDQSRHPLLNRLDLAEWKHDLVVSVLLEWCRGC